MNKGFSLIDIISVIAISGVTAILGIPTFHKFSQKQQLVADISSIVRTVNLARSKAIKLNNTVRICGVSKDLKCQNSWDEIALFDLEQIKPLYKVKLGNHYKSVIWSSFQRKPELSFNSLGFSNHLNGSLYLCHKNYTELNRQLRISKSGKVSITKASDMLASRCL